MIGMTRLLRRLGSAGRDVTKPPCLRASLPKDVSRYFACLAGKKLLVSLAAASPFPTIFLQ